MNSNNFLKKSKKSKNLKDLKKKLFCRGTNVGGSITIEDKLKHFEQNTENDTPLLGIYETNELSLAEIEKRVTENNIYSDNCFLNIPIDLQEKNCSKFDEEFCLNEKDTFGKNDQNI